MIRALVTLRVTLWFIIDAISLVFERERRADLTYAMMRRGAWRRFD